MSNPSYWNGSISWISSGDVKQMSLTVTDNKITKSAVRESGTNVIPKNSIVIVTRSGILRKYLPVAILRADMAINQDIKAIVPNSRIDSQFLLHTLAAAGDEILLSCRKAGTTVESIEFAWLKAFKITLPPRPEQCAIAEALSDVDDLIASLDKLIAKKQAVKTAVMQELLSGRRRLPGFEGEWEHTELGAMCEIVSGGTPSTTNPSFWGGDIMWCTPTDITSQNGKYLVDTERRITEAGLDGSSATLLPRGALLLCTRATIGDVKIAASPVATNQGFKSLICRNEVNNEFIYYSLLQNKSRLVELGVGSTFLEVSKHDVASFTLPIPPEQEQRAIATVLSDVDAEITALQARRDKTKAIKQGMMQELLTGRVRLV